MDAREWQALSEEERKRLHEQGKENLEEGARLAAEAFMGRMEQIGKDDALPQMPPEAVEEMMQKIHAIRDHYRQQEQGKAP